MKRGRNQRQHLAYLSCPLTGLSKKEYRRYHRFYNRIGKVLEAAGFVAYLPHIAGDPKLNPDLTPKQIRKIDRTAVGQSSVMVVYMGMASHGAGQEIEMAEIQGKPVIFLAEKGIKLSRLPLGGDTVFRVIFFKSEKHALRKLAKALKDLQGSHKKWMPDVLCY